MVHSDRIVRERCRTVRGAGAGRVGCSVMVGCEGVQGGETSWQRRELCVCVCACVCVCVCVCEVRGE